MFFPRSLIALLATLSVTSVDAAVVPIQPRHDLTGFHIKSATPKPFQAATPDKRTPRYKVLQRNASGKSRSSSLLKGIRKAAGGAASAPLDNAGGVEYLVSIQFGNQNFSAILDTGSSDTWLIASGFKCVDANGQSQSQSQCGFGTPFQGSFGSNQISGVNFNVSYGDGEFVTGDMGYEDVTIAGITVKKQEVALGNSAYWNGDSQASGLVGLAYPAITSAFEGTDPSSDSTQEPYDPLFTHMYKSNLSSPSFSLALQRGNNGGYIAFGGLPPVSFNSSFSTTSIQTMNLQGSGRQGSEASGFTFYAMTPDALVYQGGRNSSRAQTAQYIVDSGTTLIYLPSDIAKDLNNRFNPPATQSQGAYVVDCKATPPQFGVTIGGTTFYADARDLIQTDQPDQQSGQCVTAFQDGGSGPYILGDAWMKSVVVVFDVGASEMRFAHHEY